MQSNPQIEKHFLILQIAVIAFAALLTTSVIAETMVAPHERVTVMRVIDGDTVVLSDKRRVRLIGINAPELSRNNAVHQPGAMAAKQALSELVLNQRVFLHKDKEEFDRYGRTLAYLVTPDGVNINRELVRLGVVSVSLYPPNLKFSKQLLSDQQLAEAGERGLWRLQTYKRKPVKDMPQSAGEWGRFTGNVLRVENVGCGSKLWLSDDAYVWVSNKNNVYFPPLAFYRHKTIEVRGWPQQRKIYWSIQARHPSQLLIAP